MRVCGALERVIDSTSKCYEEQLKSNPLRVEDLMKSNLVNNLKLIHFFCNDCQENQLYFVSKPVMKTLISIYGLFYGAICNPAFNDDDELKCTFNTITKILNNLLNQNEVELLNYILLGNEPTIFNVCSGLLLEKNSPADSDLKLLTLTLLMKTLKHCIQNQIDFEHFSNYPNMDRFVELFDSWYISVKSNEKVIKMLKDHSTFSLFDVKSDLSVQGKF